MATQNQLPINSDVPSVQAVAKLFSELADAYNVRLKAEAPNMAGADVYARLQEEHRLRSISNQLYFEASEHILKDAVGDQQKLEKDLGKAKERLDKIQKWAQVLDLVADVLVLAGALLAKKPGPIRAALREVGNDLKENTAKA